MSTKIYVKSLDMVKTPNYFKFSNNWEVISNNAVDLYCMIYISDQLGERRYISEEGDEAVLTVTFPRKLTQGNINNSIIKTATQDALDLSLFKISLTSTEAKNLISGTVFFSLLEDTTTTTWNQNYFVKKINTGNGN